MTDNKRVIMDYMGVVPREINGRYGLSDMPWYSNLMDTPEESLQGYAKYAKYDTSRDWLIPVIRQVKSAAVNLDINLSTWRMITHPLDYDLYDVCNQVASFIREYGDSGKGVL